MAERRMVELDSAKLRALAHPLRMRLLGALRLHGPSTATALAQRLGTNSGKTSYHLRQLAEVGLVEEDTDQGTARERWWRSAHTGTTWSSTRFLEDPDDRAADDWLIGHVVRLHARWMDDWLETHREWPPEWIDASTLSDSSLRARPEALRALNEELHAVVERYRADEASEDDPDAERVTVLLHSFPHPEPTL